MTSSRRFFFVLLCLSLLFAVFPGREAVEAIPVDPIEVMSWANELAEEFVNHITAATSFEDLRTTIGQQDVLKEEANPSERTAVLAAAVRAVTDRVIKSANDLAAVLRANANITTPTEVPYFLDACSEAPFDLGLEYSDRFKTYVNMTTGALHMNWWGDYQERDYPNIYREIARLETLDEVMAINGKEDPYSTLQYVGSTHGVYKLFPAQRYKWDLCAANGTNPYDPRLRPWYVASTSGPKDLIILIDSSNSMLINGRFEKTKKAVKTLLSMLAETDFVNVIFFNEEASLSTFNETVVRATTTNKDILSAFVDAAETATGTDFVSGFRAAFNMHQETMKRGMGSNCDHIIIFITDGIASDPSEFIDSHPLKGSVKIFSYAIGRLTDYSVPLGLAKHNSGTFTILSDYADFSKIITRYYTSLGSGNALWTAPYYGASQGQLMMTYAVPVYADEEDPTSEFLGVIGVDLPLNVIEKTISSVTLSSANHTYAFMANTEGDAIFHPDFTPYPTLRFFDIETMETSVNVADYLQQERTPSVFQLMVRRPVVSGAYGNYSVMIRRMLNQVGFSEREYTYVFAPVENTPLSVVTVWPTDNVQKLYLTQNVKFSDGTSWESDRLVFGNFTPYKEDPSLAPSFVSHVINSSDGSSYEISFTHIGVTLPPGMFCNDSLEVDANSIAHQLHKFTDPSNKNPLPSCESSDVIIKANYAVPIARIASNLAAKWIEIRNHTNFTNIYTHMFYSDANGISFIYPAVSSTPFYDGRETSWYLKAISSNGKFSLSPPYIDTASGTYPVVTISRAITHDDVVLGVAGADVPLFMFQAVLSSISDGVCDPTKKSHPNTQCYVIDNHGYLLHHPTFYLHNSTTEEIRGLITNRFIGELHAPIVERLVEEGFFIKNDIVTPNRMCEQEDGSVIPCMHHSTFYTTDPDFFANRKVFDTTIANPCVRGSITMAPVGNSGVYLLVMQGTTATCKYSIVPEDQPLANSYWTEQRYVDRASHPCAAESDPEALMCPGEEETDFVCNGVGDCVDGVCICHRGDLTSPYCDAAAGIRPVFLLILVAVASVLAFMW